MPTILLICTANIIRSPIAGALLKKRLAETALPEKWHVETAGTWARGGYPAARESQELLAPLGVDLSQHRSRMVSEALLKAADLVLVMEQGHKEALRFEFPIFKERIYLLSEMVGLDTSVRDPVGGTKEDYQETVREIDQLIRQGFPRILTLARDNARMKQGNA